MGLVGENIKAIRDANKLTQAQFADLMGIKRGKIATYETTDTKPDAELAGRISQYFDITIDDLFNKRLNIDTIKIVKKVDGKELLHAAEEAAQYKAIKRNGHKDPEGSTRRGIYNVFATAGGLVVFNDDPEYIEGYVDVPEFGNIVGYVRVAGNSMYPKYCNGDLVACREIKGRKIIPYGEAYLIVTDEFRMIKYIDPFDHDEHKLTIRSEHPDFKPFTIEREDIIKLYAIKGKITKNLM